MPHFPIPYRFSRQAAYSRAEPGGAANVTFAAYIQNLVLSDFAPATGGLQGEVAVGLRGRNSVSTARHFVKDSCLYQ